MEAATDVATNGQSVERLDTPYWGVKPFRSAAVLGAGVMGSQIAAHLANAGLEVLLLDVTPEEIGKEGKPNDIVEGAFKQATKLKPDPFFDSSVQGRITLGNFKEDFNRIAEVDWVIEVVVERLDIKQDVMKRVEETAAGDAVISTNTSGLPIQEIAEGRSEGFRRRFLGTHFFNPPRYLKLFEVIPTADTDPAVLHRVSEFARVHLGKGVVVAKDTPNFIGNRIGVYAMMQALKEFLEGRYTIEEIDKLTGTLIGHPKSATFRTADVVGLDTLAHVGENLYENIPGDESRDVFQTPDLVKKLIEAGRTGQKAGEGFYKKTKEGILSINPETFEYEPPKDSDLDPKAFSGSLPDRLRALWADKPAPEEGGGRAGDFFRRTTLDLLGYTARRIPEIADSPADVDRAIRWGFGWELGPFEIWDVLGVDDVRTALAEAEIETPEWVQEIPKEGFYTTEDGIDQAWSLEKGSYVPDPKPADEWGLTFIKEDGAKELWSNDEAALLDIGDGVALYEFRSKANSLGQAVIDGVQEVVQKVEDDPDIRGMVIGNEGKNFSVGANLGEMVMGMSMGGAEAIEPFIKNFQDGVFAIRYASKPVVVATHQRVLGGGCEMTMACPYPVMAAETYIGLVELGVGLIPAGGGTTMMAAKAAELAANPDHPSEIQTFLAKHFEQIAMATVATSAQQAISMNLVEPHTIVVMNDARRLHVAKEEVLRLSEEGYRPPPRRTKIPVLGEQARVQFEVGLHDFRNGNYISDYDVHLATKLAWVMTGGDLTAPAEVSEDYLLELEREVFLSLLGEEKTQARIESILTTNKPLRN